MVIKQDDWVVHSRHGVGQVVAVETREVESGDRKAYFRIDIDMGTVWVPVEGVSRELRKLTPKGDLARYRSVLRSRPEPLSKDHRERLNLLRERLKDGSLEARCEVVRDLTALTWNKALNESSSVVLKATRRELCAEWAAAGGQLLTEASSEIGALLLEGRKIHENR